MCRLHSDRSPGGDLHHCSLDCPASARGPVGQGGRARAQCTNNLKQIGLALHSYHTARSVFPPGYVSNPFPGLPDTDQFPFLNGPDWGWGTRILPYLDQGQLYNAANLMSFSIGPDQMTVRTTTLAVFLCPDEPGPPTFVLDDFYNGMPDPPPEPWLAGPLRRLDGHEVRILFPT